MPASCRVPPTTEGKKSQVPESNTYTARRPIAGRHLRCRRCGRAYAYPEVNGPPIRCECGWWYFNHAGRIEEEFRPRIGGAPGEVEAIGAADEAAPGDEAFLASHGEQNAGTGPSPHEFETQIPEGGGLHHGP